MNGVIPPVVDSSLESPTYARAFPDLAARYKLPVYPYDPAAANRLLDDAGWVRGADGIRAKGGQTLKCTYLVRNIARRLALAEIVKNYLAQVGIEVTIKTLVNPVDFGPPALISCPVMC